MCLSFCEFNFKEVFYEILETVLGSIRNKIKNQVQIFLGEGDAA